MGSRRGRYAALVALCACGGAPPLASSGADRWTLPLIGPLEHGLLLVPVTIDGKGPYVFAIDPDATVSIVDEQIVKDGKLRTGEGPYLLDESDTEQQRPYAEVRELRVGTLTVTAKSAVVVPRGTYDTDGRRVAGVIGRDVLADSLVFAFDRDLGVATLSAQRAYHAAAGAETIQLQPLISEIENVVVPVRRRLVKANVDGDAVMLHVDLGATASQLRERAWGKAKLKVSESRGAVIDEVGTAREVTKAGVADTVAIGHAVTPQVVFVAYDDRRWHSGDLDGTLALDFFRPYVVAINWDKSTLDVVPRKDAAVAARIGRWPALAGCEHAGCVTVTIIDPLAGQPAPAQHPGVVVTVDRDASALALPLEVLIAADKPELSRLVASLPAGVARVMTHLPADYVGATLAVIDASPFPRECPTAAGCVDLLRPEVAP